MTPLFARLTIAGVGLVGGSLGAAVRAAGLAGEVVGFGRTEANLRRARERGLVDRVTCDAAAAAAGADAIVLAVPVGASAALAAALGPHANTGTLLTDVGSVKGEVVATLEAGGPASERWSAPIPSPAARRRARARRAPTSSAGGAASSPRRR